MTLWTFSALKRGRATTGWPLGDGPDGQDGVFGMPRYRPERCEETCSACADVCPSDAICFEREGETPAACHRLRALRRLPALRRSVSRRSYGGVVGLGLRRTRPR